MTRDPNLHTGQCHCGAVKFTVTLSDGFKTIRRCTCSYCRMRGAVAVSAALGGITFIAGEDRLSSYRFNTASARHFFCSICGIYTHHQRRSNQHRYGVNVACLEGVSPFDFPEIPVLDGVNHPNDTGGATQRAGTLRFEPANRLSHATQAHTLHGFMRDSATIPPDLDLTAPIADQDFTAANGNLHE